MRNENSGNRAARHAREILRDLSPDMVLDFVRTKQDEEGELNRLYEAIDAEYFQVEQQRKALENRLKEVLPDEKTKSLFEEYGALWWSDHCVQQTVFFHLGFASAMKLAGTIAPPPKLRAVG